MDRLQRNKEIINYLVFGVLTTIINIVSFYLFNQLFGLQYLWANALSILLSILFAYITNKLFVFNSRTYTLQSVLLEFISFLSFRFLSGIVDMINMWLLVEIVSVDTIGAKVLTQFVVVVLNYVFSKFFVFKK